MNAKRFANQPLPAVAHNSVANLPGDRQAEPHVGQIVFTTVDHQDIVSDAKPALKHATVLSGIQKSALFGIRRVSHLVPQAS